MRVVHKRNIISSGEHNIHVSQGTKFISVGNQGGLCTIWYETTLGAREVIRKIFCVQTGDNIPTERADFIGTVMLMDGEYVLHVYVGTEEYLI